ncbi:sulfite exporter TauE/SafE family protein [Wenzhouxiangella sp. AB-CW3]|uniref:sulfite exporter TauE/SafE family protein n=1 Tax=Wenzhouxiangella sp. AB-CW3 TaxID=2771012 RepID=UPI00168AFB57|nr:sulfite exporter TauE/SafE family protein [Wenzhouxiangella sp. AB-CW3]QOC22330.1 sulfite exporter TauE/SafE family protein [Wenzhouxiangella sp. AB-CW3]
MFTLLLILLLVGVVAGILAGLLGIGGGLVIVPALTWLLLGLGVSGDAAVTVAVATSLATMLLTAGSAVWFQHRRGALDWSAIARLGPAMALGAGAGAALAVWVPGRGLAIFFAVVAAAIGLRMLLAASPRYIDRPARPRLWWLAGPLIGGISAMIGIGGGTFSVPYLARNGFAMVKAVAVASACGWPIAAAGALVFVLSGPAPEGLAWSVGQVWLAGMVGIGLGGMAGAPLGVALAHHLPARRLRRLFGGILIIVAIRMATGIG